MFAIAEKRSAATMLWKWVVVPLGSLLSIAGTTRPAAATVIHVNTLAPETPGDGHCGLSEAIAASTNHAAVDNNACPAGSGIDTIQFDSPGTYSTASNSAIEVWNSSITFLGTGVGSTIISSTSVFGPGFQTGLPNDFCDDVAAAVIVSQSRQVTLTNLTLQSGSAAIDNIGVCLGSGKLTLNNARITAFQSRGIFALHTVDTNGFDVSLEINNSRIDNNHAYFDFYGGAGIYFGSAVATGSFTVTSSTIENNFSEDAGGGIEYDATDGVPITISGSIIRNNVALVDGGGISAGRHPVDSLEGFHVNVRSTSISGNSAQGDGGGMWMGGNGPGTQSDVFSSSITGNHAVGKGGGFYSAGQPHFTNTTIGANTAAFGGGIYHDLAESYVTMCTIAFNGDSSTQDGGGMFMKGGSKIYHYNIIANNTAVLHSDIFNDGEVSPDRNLVRITSGYNATPGGNDVLNQNPLLGSLQNLGGPTLVYPLRGGSPAIDRIPLTPAQEGELLADQRGSPRPQDGDDGAGRNGYDIGAFEQGPVEAEFLAVAARTSSVTPIPITNDANYSMKGGTRFPATLNSQFVTYAYPVLDAGTYSFVVSVRKGPDRGIYTIATANALSGPYTDRGSADLWSSSAQNAALTLGGATVTFSSAGTKYIRFTVTGQNGMSSSRNLYLDRIQLKKQ